MKKVSGIDFKTKLHPRRQGDPSCLVANSDRFIKLCGWQPQYDNLDFICKTAYDWEKASGRVLGQANN